MNETLIREIFSKYKLENIKLKQLALSYSIPYSSLRRSLLNIIGNEYTSTAKINYNKKREVNRFCFSCNKTTKNPKFCSKNCSATYTNRLKIKSQDTKNKISISINNSEAHKLGIKKHSEQFYPKTSIVRNTCKQCKKDFWTDRKYKEKKCCSPECSLTMSTARKIITIYEKHDGSTVKLESSWEIELAKWLDSKNIDWVRPKHIVWKSLDNKNRKYFADFYLTEYGIYLDPKNDYRVSTSKEKLDSISLKVTLLYGKVKEITTNLEKIYL